MSNLGLMRTAPCIAALIGALAATAPAHALIIVGDPTHSAAHTGATFEAVLTVTDATSTTATLTIALTNTTPAGVGGFLTAFVLNNPDNKISSVTVASPPTNWGLLGLGDNSENAAPFGQFDFGAGIGNNFQGGGNPSDGFAPGTGGTFMFNLVGTGLATLTAESFVNASSAPPGMGGGSTQSSFAARFRGEGVNDRVAAVPETSTYVTLLAGVVLLALRLRRRLPSD